MCMKKLLRISYLEHKTNDRVCSKINFLVDLQGPLQAAVKKRKLTWFIIIIIISPLTARVVGAPQMILQPVFSIFPCSPLPSGTCRTQACPFPDVVFPPLPLSALSSSPFHCALHDDFGQT